MKRCSTCKVEKSPDCFNKRASSKDGLQPACRECNAAYREANSEKARQYYVDHRDTWSAYWLADRTRNRERRRAQGSAWHAENAVSIRARKSAYAAANLDKMRAKVAKRNAAKLRATPSWANLEKIAEFYFAADFLSMITGDWYHVDHIVPLLGPRPADGPFAGQRIVSGLHCEENLQVILGDDNSSKSNRHWPDMP